MANILDIRRRIRSVVNTRQITKAMKVVSAAKLRRAQERTLAARPYATMLTNVLKSLVTRAEIYDPETGQAEASFVGAAGRAQHSADRGHRRQRIGGRLQCQHVTKAASRFLESKAGKKIDIEAIGRKGRDFLRRRYPAAAVQTRSLADTEESTGCAPCSG